MFPRHFLRCGHLSQGTSTLLQPNIPKRSIIRQSIALLSHLPIHPGYVCEGKTCHLLNIKHELLYTWNSIPFSCAKREASKNVTSRSASKSFLLPTRTITISALASVLASVSQLFSALYVSRLRYGNTTHIMDPMNSMITYNPPGKTRLQVHVMQLPALETRNDTHSSYPVGYPTTTIHTENKQTLKYHRREGRPQLLCSSCVWLIEIFPVLQYPKFVAWSTSHHN